MKFLLSLLFLGFSVHLHAQKLTYDAYLRGNKVGKMTVVREVSDNKTSISSTTHIEAHMLFTIKVDVSSESVYQNGELIESTAVSKQNGNIHSQVEVIKKNNNYAVNIDGELKTLNKNSIVGADVLYFEEPKQIKETLALASGEELKIENEGEGNYFFIHGGKKEKHQYANGILQQVTIEHSLYTVVLKLQQ